jgi:hypothetical protein
MRLCLGSVFVRGLELGFGNVLRGERLLLGGCGGGKAIVGCFLGGWLLEGIAVGR